MGQLGACENNPRHEWSCVDSCKLMGCLPGGPQGTEPAGWPAVAAVVVHQLVRRAGQDGLPVHTDRGTNKVEPGSTQGPALGQELGGGGGWFRDPRPPAHHASRASRPGVPSTVRHAGWLVYLFAVALAYSGLRHQDTQGRLCTDCF